MSPFLKLRSFISVFALGAFLHGQVALCAEHLQPGMLAPAKQDPAANQTQQPKENPSAEQPQAPQGDQAKPPLPSGGETVVQVSVPKDDNLDITVLEGEGATNVVGKKSADRPLVQVTDNGKEGVDGATVTFIAPADGPSVIFSNGLRTMTVMTDAKGRARAPTMRAVNTGSFKIQISASYHGEMISTTVSQTNYETKAEAANAPAPATTTSAPEDKPAKDRPVATKKSGLSGTTLALIIGGAAAVGLGVALGAGHKSSSSSTSTSTATIGTGGTPTIGAPH